MGKCMADAKVVSQRPLAAGIHDLVLEADGIASQAAAGQFISIYSGDGSRLLPRPISLCGIDREHGRIRLVYRVAGKGTKEFSRLKAGDSVRILGPLGNGFRKGNGRAIVVGGGIGIPPMLELVRELSGEISVVLGYRDEIFLAEEFEPYGRVYLSSEDGRHGVKGNVIDAIEACGVTGDTIYACGPLPMLRGIKAYAEKCGIACQISLEDHMACGVGACLACVCQTTEKNAHSQVHNARICADGPVFDAGEVEL